MVKKSQSKSRSVIVIAFVEFQACATVMRPIIIQKLMLSSLHFRSSESEKLYTAFYLLLLWLLTTLGSICFNAFAYYAYDSGFRVRVALTGLIFRKVFHFYCLPMTIYNTLKIQFGFKTEKRFINKKSAYRSFLEICLEFYRKRFFNPILILRVCLKNSRFVLLTNF